MKRVYSAICPFCGRSYRKSVWDRVLGARVRGILGFGQPVPCLGQPRFGKANVTLGDGAELDAALGVGFFAQFKDRLAQVIKNWLGNGWLTRAALGELLKSMFEVKAGYAVAAFGPGTSEDRLRSDVARFSWGSLRDIPKPLPRRDIGNEIWG